MISGTEYELANTLDGMPFMDVIDDPGSFPEKYLSVRVGSEHYVIAAESVVEVVQPSPIAQLPGAPQWISGLVNFRGEIAAVLNVKALFGNPDEEPETAGKLVILDWMEDGVRLALRVDQVSDHAGDDAWVIELSKLRSMLEAGLE